MNRNIKKPQTEYTEQQILNLWHRNHGELVSGVKALSDDAAAVSVVISDTPCLWVDVVALNGRIAVGGSTSKMDSGNERGIILYPGNPPYRIFIEDLSKLYAAGASGTKLCYAYLPPS